MCTHPSAHMRTHVQLHTWGPEPNAHGTTVIISHGKICLLGRSGKEAKSFLQLFKECLLVWSNMLALDSNLANTDLALTVCKVLSQTWPPSRITANTSLTKIQDPLYCPHSCIEIVFLFELFDIFIRFKCTEHANSFLEIEWSCKGSTVKQLSHSFLLLSLNHFQVILIISYGICQNFPEKMFILYDSISFRQSPLTSLLLALPALVTYFTNGG